MGSLDWAPCHFCDYGVKHPYMIDFPDGEFGPVCEWCETGLYSAPFQESWMVRGARDHAAICLRRNKLLPTNLSGDIVTRAIASYLFGPWKRQDATRTLQNSGGVTQPATEPSSENSAGTTNTSQVQPQEPRCNPINIKKDIFAPLNAECVWDEDTKQWTVPANKALPKSSCNWESALGSNYPRGQQVTHCVAVFFQDEADANQGGKPRLDIVVTFSNGMRVRFHPGAKPIWSTEQQPTAAMIARTQRMLKQRGLIPPKRPRGNK